MATANPIHEVGTVTAPEPADLLIRAVAMLPEQMEVLTANLSAIFQSEKIAIATESPIPGRSSSSLQFINAPPAKSDWSLTAAEFAHASQLSRETQAKAVLMLGPGAESLAPGALLQLANAVLNGSTDLSMPRYTLPPNAGLTNSAILYPLTRALFATRVRYPFAIDLGLSARMAQRLGEVAQKATSPDPSESLIWPVNEAAVVGFQVEEFEVGHRVFPQPVGTDVNSIIQRVTGSLFADIESKAAYWQRTRRTPPPHRIVSGKQPSDGTAEVPRMVDSFRFAYNNLLEIWSLVLPPHSLLGLKRLSTLNPADFRMPDGLWARIVFDFLVAYRLRTINRGHLLGAFIPLYLAWVAGHINLTSAGTDPESHLETVAAAFESDKPYLVSRWRWPDRFNS